jgi:cobalt-zinc-cadmium efflux system membrane fusion protein
MGWPLVAVGLALLGAGCSKNQEEAPKAVEASGPPVSSARGGAGDIVIPPEKMKQITVERAASAEVPADEVISPGKVEANPNRTSRVLLPVAGKVSKVFVRIGDAVKQGQVLLTVESPDIDAAISVFLQSQAAVTQSRAALAKAEADLERTRDLFENNAVAKKEVLNAENVRTQNRAALDQALASETQSSRRLEILGVKPGEFGQTLQVHAPVSGKVLEMSVVPGEYRNDTSTPVMTIADLSTVWVTSDVPESSIRLVQMGQRVQIAFDAWPGQKFTGRVKQIADVVDPQTRTLKVRAELENPDGRLRPEMFARIVLTDKFETRPVVPAAAVMQGDAGSWVMREVGEGRFRQTRVTTGNRIGDSVAILSGLAPGDRIVTDGVMLVRN